MIALRLGFLPLTDCAPLVVARELGFAEAEGVALSLVRDVSWATARDRLVYRQVQGSHMLAPLAVAVTLGLSEARAALAAPIGLSLNGSRVVVSAALAGAMGMASAACLADPRAAAAALANVARRRRPVLGVVHRFSSHALILRYWLAVAGIDAERDLDLRVLPPSFMVEALRGGEIDGFCAGEPWGEAAAQGSAQGSAVTVATASGIWRRCVEKVLALRQDWMDANPDATDRLLRALDAAARWCDQPENRSALAALLARPEYLDQPFGLIEAGLAGRIAGLIVPDAVLFHAGAANFPWRSQAAWIHAQFVRWSQAAPGDAAAARAVFRPDIYRRALAGGPTSLPLADSKAEGTLAQPTRVPAQGAALILGPDQFFDHTVFNPLTAD